jgi:glucose-1-phosphate thymidylyltransferase
MTLRGIILAGGKGTRLLPATKVVSKQLLAVYDKPMIYYPLSTLMLAGVREILIITTPEQAHLFQALFGDGSQLGIDVRYATQETPRGIADALLVGRDFIDGHRCVLVLGDNIFYGTGLMDVLHEAAARPDGATIFAQQVKEPERYGTVAFDRHGNVVAIVEKPTSPPSNHAVVGLYFYDERAVEIAARLQPSSRGELEITDVNQHYLDAGALTLQLLGRGYAWFDAGTFQSLLDASAFVQTVESRQGLKIACIEEVAYHMGYIDVRQLESLGDAMGAGDYAQYVMNLARAGDDRP